MLWLPTTILAVLIVAGGFWAKYLISINQKWKIKIDFESDTNQEPLTCYLKNNQKIAIGDNNLTAIPCPGEDIRGYLGRKGNKLYIKPTNNAPLLYRDRELNKEEQIKSDNFSFNCPFEGQNFEIRVIVVR